MKQIAPTFAREPSPPSRFAVLSLGPVACLLALAAGCEVGPNYKRPTVLTPNGYGELAAGAATRASQASRATSRPVRVTQWWATFNDPELDSLIDRAVKSNLDLRQAESRVRQARAQAIVAGASQYPSIDAGAGYQHARGSKNVQIPFGAFAGAGGAAGRQGSGDLAPPNSRGRQPPGNSGTGGASGASGPPAPFVQSPFGGGGFPGVDTNLYQAGFDASWEIDVFGGVRRNVEAAGADVAAGIEDRRDALVTLLAETARAYVTLRGSQRQASIARENYQSQRETLDLTINRADKGLSTDLDVARARAQVAETAAALPALQASARQSMHQIALLLGEQPTALVAELSAESPIPPVPPEVPVGLPSELLRRRPDIRRAEAQVAAATARVGAATAELFPRFSLTGAFGLDSTKPGRLVNWDSRYFLFSPSVTWPVFDAGRIRANIDVQNARQQQAATTYEQTILTALKDVEDALVGYSQEQARRRSLDEAASADQLAVKLATDQYQQGLTDFLTVLEAQRSLFAAQDALAQSDRAISADLVALYKALGGGWEIELKPE